MLNLLRSTCFFMLFCSLAMTHAAEQSSSDATLRLDEVVNDILTRHPELAAKQIQTEAVAESQTQAGTWENPMLSFGMMDMPRKKSWPNAEEKRVTLEQKIPWPGKQILKKEIAGLEKEKSKLSEQELALRWQRRAKETFYRLYALQQSLAILQDDGQVLARLAELAQVLYSSGTRPQTDIHRLEVERTLLRQQLLELTLEADQLRHRLHTWMQWPAERSLPPLAAPPAIAPVSLSKDEVTAASHQRPNVQSSWVEARQANAMAELKRKELRPDIIAGAEYRLYNPGQDMVMFMFGIELPIWRQSLKAGIREAELLQQASINEMQVKKQENAIEAEATLLALRTAQQSLQLYQQELLPRTKAAFLATEASYRNGKTDFLEVLASWRTWLETRSKMAMLESEIGILDAQLEEATTIARP